MDTLTGFLVWLVSPIAALFASTPQPRLLSRTERRHIARKQANETARKYQGMPRKWRRRLASVMAKVYFQRSEGATV